MQIVFLNGTAGDALKVTTSDSLLIVSAFSPQEIDMVAELESHTDTIKRLASHSLKCQLTIVYLYRAKVHNKRYLSTIVIDNGRIIGVTDMTHHISELLPFDRGQCYRVYESKRGKFGVMIGDDLYFPEASRLLRVAGCQYLVAVTPLKLDNPTRLALKAHSLFNGINTIYHTADECGVINLFGSTFYKTTDFCAELEINIQYDDRLILARREDIYNDIYINDN